MHKYQELVFNEKSQQFEFLSSNVNHSAKVADHFDSLNEKDKT